MLYADHAPWGRLFVSILVFGAALLFMLAGRCFPAGVELAWDQPSDTDRVDGYKIYCGPSGTTITDQADKVITDPAQTTCSISGLAEGQIYGFIATSFDDQGNESGYSNEIYYNVPDADATLDTDNDGLTDAEETGIYGTDPGTADTDGDGLNDSEEVAYWGPNEWDKDYDGDGKENILDKDADNDGVSDGREVIDGTNPAESDLQAEFIPQSGMSVVSVDSEEHRAKYGAATNAIDGDPTTFWHTELYKSEPDPPHEIVIDLGRTYAVQGLSYLPRQDGLPDGTIKGYAIYLSRDGSGWGDPVLTGTWTWSVDFSGKEVDFQAQSARYLKLVAMSEINQNPWTSAAEINVLGQ